MCEELIICEICKQNFGQISGGHTKKHGLTLKEYITKFPNSPIISPAASKRKAERISAAKKGKPAPNKGIPMSQEQKDKISKAKKEKFASGELVPTRTGAILSSDTKGKIAASLKEYFKPIVEENTTKKEAARLARIKKVRDKEDLIESAVPEFEKEPKEKIRYSTTENRYDSILRNIESANAQGIEVLRIERKKSESTDDTFYLRCNTCHTEFTRCSGFFVGNNRARICDTCNPRDVCRSRGEIEVDEFIRSVYPGRVVSSCRTALGGREIDTFIPDLNLGIEFTGLYWHSEEAGVHPKYHLREKMRLGESAGIRIIFIFEDEWENSQDIVKSRILSILGLQQNKLYARNCTILEIDNKSKSAFLKSHHIRGDDKSSIRYGAFYGDMLVGVMTFKPTNMIKGGDGSSIELSRFATISGYTITGLASKLFARFVKDHAPSTVISYSDLRWNTGEVYNKMGFELESTSHPCFWYIPNGKIQRYHRAAFMKHRIVEKLGGNPEKTAHENMVELGYSRIWDCGQLKFVWTAPGA